MLLLLILIIVVVILLSSSSSTEGFFRHTHTHPNEQTDKKQYTYNSILTVYFKITNSKVVLYLKNSILDLDIEIWIDETISYFGFASRSDKKDGSRRQ